MERGEQTAGGCSSPSHVVHLDSTAPEKVDPAEGISDSHSEDVPMNTGQQEKGLIPSLPLSVTGKQQSFQSWTSRIK